MNKTLIELIEELSKFLKENKKIKQIKIVREKNSIVIDRD